VRLPRIFGKKRGHRRSGSQAWGTFGDGLFHGLLLLAGLIFGGLLVSGVAVPEWRMNHDFVGTRCTVLGKGLVRRTIEDPPGSFSSTWQPCLRVRYETAGIVREQWTRPAPSSVTADREAAVLALQGWSLGDDVPAWYDPAAPDIVVLERGYNWWLWLLALLLPGALLAFGGKGLLRSVRRWGKSEEHRAAAGSLSDLLDPVAAQSGAGSGFPGVPSCDDLVNSPGTILRYRLPIESPEKWTLLGLGLFALSWNAIVAVLGVEAGIDLVRGRADWLLLALLLPFVVVGVGGIVSFIRTLIFATAVGTTQVEISDHPLRPGGRYDVLLAQGGAGTFRSLEVSLELEEQATFRQGTDTRSDRLVVWHTIVDAWKGVQLSPGTRFEARAAISIPAEAMHSFASEHNLVRWRLAVRGTPLRWPSFERVFPLVVFPAAGGDRGRRGSSGGPEASP
jgi:hypothetical protein